jgi:hypothetical protein
VCGGGGGGTCVGLNTKMYPLEDNLCPMKGPEVLHNDVQLVSLNASVLRYPAPPPPSPLLPTFPPPFSPSPLPPWRLAPSSPCAYDSPISE